MNKNIRHPEKRNLKDQFSPKKPDWIKVRFTNNQTFLETKKIVRNNNLITVCEEANCPNISECWSKKHATLMIMGDICTRACSFCNISTGKPLDLDYFEPYNIATAVKKLGLKHVVITSVDRDDLEDGGVKHFIKTIKSIRQTSPKTTIEVLTPDFIKNKHASIQLSEAEPDVFNHNLETVPSLYNEVRPGARYFNSLKLLHDIKSNSKKIFTKSGIMVGLGETRKEIIQVMDDLRSANVDFITIGQYLQPTPKHYPIKKFITPEEFDSFKTLALGKGFLMVASSPLTRSSYHATEDFQILQNKRK